MTINLTRAGLIVALLAAIWSTGSLWLAIPMRLSATEAGLQEVRTQSRTDHDLLSRIDERTERMEKTVDRIMSK